MPFVSNFPSNCFMAFYLCLEAERAEIQTCASVRKPQAIFFLVQLSQGKICWAQVVLSFALGLCTCREHPTHYSRDPGISRQGSDISYGNMQ